MSQAGHFSLLEGGPFYRLARRCGLPAGDKGLAWLGIALAVITWVPLFVLAALEGHLTSGSSVPFLSSHVTYARLLIAIPLFFVAEAQFNLRVRQTIRELVGTVVRPEQRPRFDALLELSTRRRDSWLADGFAIVVTLLLSFTGAGTGLPKGVTSWLEYAPGDLTAAGWWYFAVSLPISRFLICRWAVHLLRWGRLLWRLSRLDLELFPTHPDRAAGLAGLGIAQVALWPLAAGTSAMVVTVFAEEVLIAGAAVQSFAMPLMGLLALTAMLLVAPLCLFTPRLFDVKQRGLLQYGELAQQYVREFDTKWLRGGARREEILGSADVQSLADLSGSFDIIRSMRFVPIVPVQVLTIVFAAAVPMLPLVFFVVSLDQLVLRSVRAFLNL
jgi:hypothetical protein